MDFMGHAVSAAPRNHLRRRDRRGDPACPTCRGSGLFSPEWKATQTPLPCPRCRRPGSLRAVGNERQPGNEVLGAV